MSEQTQVLSLELSQIKLFGKWSYEWIDTKDPSLKRYLCLKPVYLPHTGGRHEGRKFGKGEVPVVERLVNKLMMHGRNAGKKHLAYNIIKKAFDIIHIKTGENPIKVLIRAIENSAPREDTTRIMYGGIAYHVSVDVSPLRRIDTALKHLTEGARLKAFNNPMPIEEALAEEIILAANSDPKSYAIQRKDEMERIALSSR